VCYVECVGCCVMTAMLRIVVCIVECEVSCVLIVVALWKCGLTVRAILCLIHRPRRSPELP